MSKAKRFRNIENNQNIDVNDNTQKVISNRSKLKKKIILGILSLIFIIGIIYSIVNIILWNIENQNTNAILQEVANHITVDKTKTDDDIEKYVVNFEELKNKNPETVAWIKVNGTNIEYPVVKAKDNEYYLTHSFDHTYNSAGWPFADYRNKFDSSDKNIIIYGHNRRDDSMFGTLKNIFTEEWYNNLKNRKVLFYTEAGDNVYDVFSVYTVEDEDYYITTKFSNNFEKFVNTLKKRSERVFDVEVKENDQILTLSTCGAGDTRVVLHAKKTQ